MLTLAAVAIMAPLLQDGPAELPRRVRAIVERISNEDLQGAEDALDELVKLGPPALDAIKAELAAAGGDLKLRLESASKRIEREVRRATVMGAPIIVSLMAEKRTVTDVLDEFQKSSGQSIEYANLPPEPVTLSLDKAAFWDALDAICRAHRGVMWSIREEKILVEKKPYRELPRVVLGNVMACFLSTQTSHTVPPTSSSFSLSGVMAWTKGARPSQASLAFEEIEDDKGTKLSDPSYPLAWAAEFYADPRPETQMWLSCPVHALRGLGPMPEAEKFGKFKGAFRARYVLGTKTLLSVRDILGARGAAQPAGDFTITVVELTTNSETSILQIDVSHAGDPQDTGFKPQNFVGIDAKGQQRSPRSCDCVSQSITVGPGGRSSNSRFMLTWDLATGGEPKAFDLLVPSDVEEIVLPFEFKGLPIK